MDKSLKFTDPFFAKAIADISANGTLYFTPKQFVYFLDRRLKRKGSSSLVALGCMYFFLLLIFSLILGSFSGPLGFILFNGFCLFLLYRGSCLTTSSRRERRTCVKAMQLLGVAIAILGSLYAIGTGSLWLYFALALLSGGALWLSWFQSRRIERIAEEFVVTAELAEGWLARWTQIHESIPQLLPQQPLAIAAAEEPSADVTAYSFDRLVVCQSDAVAQMLIANNFHFEHNCAILSISGYPQRIFDTTMQMLRRNPELQVFALHDCCASGVAMAQQLRTSPKWFADSSVSVIDVGLLPRQIVATKRALFVHRSDAAAQQANQLQDEVRQGLTAEEIAWLEAGYFIEVESFTPQRLIRILTEAIARSQAAEGSVAADSLIMIDDSSSAGYFYAAESFG